MKMKNKLPEGWKEVEFWEYSNMKQPVSEGDANGQE